MAAVWTWFVPFSSHVFLPWTSPVAMFLAVWMLYAADRLLDARYTPDSDLEDRHRFHAQHRYRFATAMGFAAVCLVFLLFRLCVEELRLFACVGSLLFAYFFLIHLWPTAKGASHPARLPKELAVGVFFAAAVFIPTVARVPALRNSLILPAIIFGAICTLNCLYVYVWEHPSDHSAAHWTTRFTVRHLVAFTCAVGAGALVLTAFRPPAAPPVLFIACAGSAALFLTLNAYRHRMRASGLRAAVDLALLTPLLVVPLFRLFAR